MKKSYAQISKIKMLNIDHLAVVLFLVFVYLLFEMRFCMAFIDVSIIISWLLYDTFSKKVVLIL